MLPNLIVALYALLPVALLTSASLPSGVFYALIAACLALLVQKRFAGAREQTYLYRWLIASYSVLFLAVASSSIYYGDWAGANSEGALRFFLGLWVLLLALPHVGVSKLRHSIWGVYAAALIATSILLWLIINVNPRPNTPGLILTTYTSIMVLLGAIAVYSLKWQLTQWSRYEQGLKILTALVATIGFFAAQTRTGLLGIPVFVLLGLVLCFGAQHRNRAVAFSVLIVAALFSGLAANDAWRARIVDGVNEVVQCQGESATINQSMCVRLQLWNSAIHAGAGKPFAGLGDGGRFSQYLEEVAFPQGLVSQAVVDDYFGEPHSDLLLMFAAFGFPGLLGLLLIYLAPCGYFVRRLLLADSNQNIRAAAAMGLAVCLGFALFGLPETMFRRMNTMGFYTAFVALFLILSTGRSEKKPQG